MEEEREASPPPLLAFTESYAKHKVRKPGSKARSSKTQPRRTFKKQAEPIVFDEKARFDYLTGFHKRKQSRIEASKKKAVDREKQERIRLRAEARKSRKEQAQENVRMEKIAYGGESDEEDNQDNNAIRELSPSAYETEEHHTTVTVQEWNPNEEPQEAKSNFSKAHEKAKAINNALPPSSRRMAKKLKNNQSNVKELSDLIQVDNGAFMAAKDDAESVPSTKERNGKNGSKKPIKKFHYETKLERAKAKAKIKEDKIAFAEKRKAKQRAQQGGNNKNKKKKTSKKH